jgi:hypothetical protein
MNEEAKLWFGWVEVVALWCVALTAIALRFWAKSQGNLSSLEALGLSVFFLIGGIALIGTMVLTADYWSKPEDQPYQVGTTPWDRDDHGMFWARPPKS